MGSQMDKNFFKSNSEVYCMISTWLRLKLCFPESSWFDDSRVSWSQEELTQVLEGWYEACRLNFWKVLWSDKLKALCCPHYSPLHIRLIILTTGFADQEWSQIHSGGNYVGTKAYYRMFQKHLFLVPFWHGVYLAHLIFLILHFVLLHYCFRWTG